MAYICLECGHVFDEPAHWEERHGFDHGPFEQWTGCPACHGGYSDARQCVVCGEYFAVDAYYPFGGEPVCDNCRQEEDD